MESTDLKKARQLLGLSQREIGVLLGWSGAKQISNLETGARPITEQTALAVECLLRRAGKWSDFAR
jgi:transcriptional regulator with XRE-family HTH domain